MRTKYSLLLLLSLPLFILIRIDEFSSAYVVRSVRVTFETTFVILCGDAKVTGTCLKVSLVCFRDAIFFGGSLIFSRGQLQWICVVYVS